MITCEHRISGRHVHPTSCTRIPEMFSSRNEVKAINPLTYSLHHSVHMNTWRRKPPQLFRS